MILKSIITFLTQETNSQIVSTALESSLLLSKVLHLTSMSSNYFLQISVLFLEPALNKTSEIETSCVCSY